MHEAVRTEVFEIPLDPLYRVIVDYERYPEFVDHVTKVKLLSEKEGGARAKFTIHVVKDLSYTLDLEHDYPRGISWTLVRSDIFRDMTGSWGLKPKGKKKTEVTYTAAVAPKILAPQFIVQRLVQHSLPSMMRAFYERAKRVHGQA